MLEKKTDVDRRQGTQTRRKKNLTEVNKLNEEERKEGTTLERKRETWVDREATTIDRCNKNLNKGNKLLNEYERKKGLTRKTKRKKNWIGDKVEEKFDCWRKNQMNIKGKKWDEQETRQIHGRNI